MVFYYESQVVDPYTTLYMGKDKFESEYPSHRDKWRFWETADMKAWMECTEDISRMMQAVQTNKYIIMV